MAAPVVPATRRVSRLSWFDMYLLGELVILIAILVVSALGALF